MLTGRCDCCKASSLICQTTNQQHQLFAPTIFGTQPKLFTLLIRRPSTGSKLRRASKRTRQGAWAGRVRL
jgi:hypothetical protein